MKRTIQYLVGGVLSAALVFGGVFVTQSVAAQTTTPTTTATAVTPTTTDEAAPTAPQRDGGRHGGRHGDTTLIETVATALGISADELRTQLDGTTSMADLLTAADINSVTVLADYLAAKRAEFTAAVAAGTLTQARADLLIANHEARAAEQLNAVVPRQRDAAFDAHADHHLLITSVADALGISADAVRTQLDGTTSMADLLNAAGIATETVVADYLADLTTVLKSAVTAGTLTQAQVDARLADAEIHASSRLTQIMPLFEGRAGRAGRHGNDGRGGHGHGMRGADCAPGSATAETGFHFGTPRETTTD